MQLKSNRLRGGDADEEEEKTAAISTGGEDLPQDRNAEEEEKELDQEGKGPEEEKSEVQDEDGKGQEEESPKFEVQPFNPSSWPFQTHLFLPSTPVHVHEIPMPFL